MYIYLGIGLKKGIWPKITLYAAKLWQLLGYKDELFAQILISQIIKFKENKFLYKIGYDSQLMTPFMWWGFVEDKFDNLKVLAKKIFAITPHSASCERIFSILGWFYGKKRQRLSLKNLESLTKIRHHNLFNARKELPYGTKNKTDEELAVMIQESYLFEDDENERNDSENNDSESDNDDFVIPNHQVMVVINDVVDLNHQAFNLVDGSYILNEENNRSDIAMNEVHEFDLEKLIQDQNFE